MTPDKPGSNYATEEVSRDMMERLNALVAEGNWSGIVAEVDSILSGVSVADRARALLLVSTAYHNTATSGDDWRASLHHAREALAVAPHGTVLRSWSLKQVGSLLSDMRRNDEAKGYLLAYLDEPEQSPRQKPYVLVHLGLVAYQERNYGAALAYWRDAVALFESLGDALQVQRVHTFMAWSYAHLGQTNHARQMLAAVTIPEVTYLRDGAEAACLYADGQYAAAYTVGRRALAAGSRLAFDLADAADVCFILAKCAQHLGRTEDAIAFTRSAAEFAALQSVSVDAMRVLSERARGGDSPEQTASRGSGGYHPGSRYLSGVPA